MNQCGVALALVLGSGAMCSFAWDMGEPIVSYWAGPGYPGHPERMTERAAKELKAAGFNTVWCSSPAELDVAQKYGLRTFYDMHIDCRVFQTSDTNRLTQIAAEVKRVKDHPALFCYRHCDEPWEAAFGDLAKMRQWLQEQDPTHPCWVNLLPTYADNKQLGIDGEILSAYREYVRRFCETYLPEVLSDDHYQFYSDHDGPDYLLNLSIIRESAAAAGIPFANGVQTCVVYPGKPEPRAPGVDELRFLVYTTLAYGAQGIYYFVYSFPAHHGSIVGIDDGRLSDKYEALKELNPTFVAIAKELRRFRFSGAYLQGVQARGATPYCDAALLKLSPKVDNLPMGDDGLFANTTLVTRFDSPDEPTRLMVVNMDYKQPRTVSVEAPSPLERFDPQSQAWKSVGGKTASLRLDRGAGVLLRLAH